LIIKVAKTLGRSIEETMQLSVLELQMWSAWFKLEYDEEQKVMNKNKPVRHRRR